MAVIDLNSTSRVYGFGDNITVALDEVDLTINKGEFVAIMGPSGSGKSTLMNVIGLLDTATHGVYKLDGKDVSSLSQKKRAQTRREKIGFVFQSFNLLPRLTVIDNVALPLVYKGIAHVKRLKRAERMLRNVGLGERQYYMPNQLSGGQVQRVAVARALVNKPSLILADEPTGNLDTASSTKIMELFRELHQAGNTIVMITHNPELAEYAERFVMMRDGKIELDTHNLDEALDLITHGKKAAKAQAEAEVKQEAKEQAVEQSAEKSDKIEVRTETSKKKTKKKSKKGKKK
jgi:putative ABC transport system ATP-binding protein